jgi:SAM-dependent methyltransferase
VTQTLDQLTGVVHARYQRTADADVHGQIFRCPSCLGPTCAQTELRCAHCGRGWPIEQGVVRFGGADPRRHALSAAQRWTVAGMARTLGWQAALHDVLRGIDPQAYRQAVDEYRAQWRFVLPLSRTSRVLDLNSGWGAVALNLAEVCGTVVAADACPAQAAFLAGRSVEMGRTNVVSLQLGLDRPLPFADETFDVVVLIDGTRWLRTVQEQRALLARARRVLRRDGYLFLADANRADPRRLVRSAGDHGARTLAGYGAMLRAAGFRRLEMYAPIPCHTAPFFMIPLANAAPFTYALRTILSSAEVATRVRGRGKGVVYRLCRWAAEELPPALLATLGRPFVPSVAFVARP